MLAILRTRGLAGFGVCTGWGTRRAELVATMDHADIRGLVTALHRSVAGLPRSSIGDHRGGCPHSSVEGSPHRVRASRCRSGVSTVTSWSWSLISPVSRSRTRCNVPADIPNEGGEFARERDTDLVVVQSAGLEAPVAVVQAQLRPPGDRADLGRLSLLTQLQALADAGGGAGVPGRLDQYAAHVSVAGLGDRPEPSLRTARVLGGDHSQVPHQLARMREAPSIGDHRGGCPHSSVEGSPHRVRASRCRSGVSTVTSWSWSLISPVSRSRTRCNVPADIPNEGGEFARERDTD